MRVGIHKCHRHIVVLSYGKIFHFKTYLFWDEIFISSYWEYDGLCFAYLRFEAPFVSGCLVGHDLTGMVHCCMMITT